MFKGLSVFFETYSITSDDNKNSALHPIEVSCDVDSCIKRAKELLAKLGYGDFVVNENFKEMFAKTEKFEVTVSFIVLQNGGTRIGVAVFSPKGKLTKKILIGLMQQMSLEFGDEKI
ncbi:MAG: hypothetical protein K2F90_05845 [Clostridiales bacterium]|nr:hypothetical protein [Clostridiales bacterium]